MLNTIQFFLKIVEYRAITSSVTIFVQDNNCDAVCILLKGSGSMILDGPTVSSSNLVVGDLKPGDIFGHIDLLMQFTDCSTYKELLRYMKDDDDELSNDELLDQTPTAIQDQEGEINQDNDSTAASELDTNSNGLPLLPTLGPNKANSPLQIVAASPSKSVTEDVRAINPHAFATCELTGMTEMLLIPASVFESTLLQLTEKEFQSRLAAVKACGVFNSWPKHDILRLSRMAQFRTAKVILL